MFGKSFVYVIFEDGTDIYWARSRVLEYLSAVRGTLPEGVNPVLGPDATGVGWVYRVRARRQERQTQPRRAALVPGLAPALRAGIGARRRRSRAGRRLREAVPGRPRSEQARSPTASRISDVVNAIRMSQRRRRREDVRGRPTEYYVRGRGYIKSVEDIENVAAQSREAARPSTSKNVGTVHLGPDIRRGVAELNGEGEVVGGIVVMRYGENALARDRRRSRRSSRRSSRRCPKACEIVADLRSQRADQARHRHAARNADRGKHRRRAGLLRVPLARPLRAGRHPHAADRDPALVHPDVRARTHREHHVARRHRHRDRRDGRRGDHHGRERPQDARALPRRARARPRDSHERDDVIIARGAGGRPSALLLAARHHRQLHSGVHARSAGGPSVQAARVHQDLLDVLRRAARRDARARADGAAHPRQDHAGEQEPDQPLADLGSTSRSCTSCCASAGSRSSLRCVVAGA